MSDTSLRCADICKDLTQQPFRDGPRPWAKRFFISHQTILGLSCVITYYPSTDWSFRQPVHPNFTQISRIFAIIEFKTWEWVISRVPLSRLGPARPDWLLTTEKSVNCRNKTNANVFLQLQTTNNLISSATWLWRKSFIVNAEKKRSFKIIHIINFIKIQMDIFESWSIRFKIESMNIDNRDTLLGMMFCVLEDIARSYPHASRHGNFFPLISWLF